MRSVILVSLLGATVVAGCGPDGRPAYMLTEDGGAGETDASSNEDTFGPDTDAGVEGTCSADLQSVIDKYGAVVQTCPADQGCADGKCVPACRAVEQMKGSRGCDFWAPESPFFMNGEGTTYDGSCYAVFIANTWTRPARIEVSRGEQRFDLQEFGRIPSGIVPDITYEPVPAEGVPPNQVAVLFLSHKPGARMDHGASLTCPVTPAYSDDAAVSGNGKGQAFHIVSDTPIAAYDILPHGGATSYLPGASLLFPSKSWGTNYYVVAPRPSPNGSLWMLVTSSSDNNAVTLAAPGASQPSTYTLDAGETMQWLGTDPTSTVIESASPISVFTGSTNLQVRSQTSPAGGGRDAAHQQIPHIMALGSEYVGPGVVTRLESLAQESVPYRVVGVIDGTMLTYDPAPPEGAPTALSAGEVVEFEATSFFVVRSQDDGHPFSFTQYMPGAPALAVSREGCGPERLGLPGCVLGDEEWVNIVAPKQFAHRYVVFTDPTYATSNLVLTRARGRDGFSEVSIDCLGGDVTGWSDVDSAGMYQVAHVDLTRSGQPVAQCTGSRHEVRSKGQFGVMVWGTDTWASYGYPAAGSLEAINEVVVPTGPR